MGHPAWLRDDSDVRCGGRMPTKESNWGARLFLASLAGLGRPGEGDVRKESSGAEDARLVKIETKQAPVPARQQIISVRRLSRARFAMAFGVAAVSDFLSIWTEFAPPIQWLIDLATAGLLFLILGRRWALLPGLVAEAIPGMGVFPVWILVVMSLVLYNEIKAHRKL